MRNLLAYFFRFAGLDNDVFHDFSLRGLMTPAKQFLVMT